MVGVSTHKKARRFPYYLCAKRWNTRECDQDYIRADHVEATILQDIKAMFRDEPFIARVREEANKRIVAAKPDLEKEIAWLENQMTKAQGAIDRYFEAFETGTLKADLCSEKVGELKARLVGLEAERRDLENRRNRLELPAIDLEMLTSFVANLEQLIAAGTNPQKKHLLRLLVKKVLVHDRHTVEVWYALLPPFAGHTPESETVIQRHFGTTSPADVDDLVEGVADMVVGFLKGGVNPGDRGKTSRETKTDVVQPIIPDMRRVG